MGFLSLALVKKKKKIIYIYIYILRGFRKLVMVSKNVKNAPNLIRKSLFLKIKN